MKLVQLTCSVSLCCLLLAAPVFAQSTGLSIENVQVGFDGAFKVGALNPVEFDITGPAGAEVTPTIETADPDGRAMLLPVQPVTLSSEGRGTVRTLFRSGLLQAPISVEAASSDGLSASLTIPVTFNSEARAVRKSTQVWIGVGCSELMTAIQDRWNSEVSGSFALGLYEQLDGQIWSADCLDGVDVMVIDAMADVSDSDWSAIRRWVSRGGRLIVGLGPAADPASAGSIPEWLPIQPTGMLDLGEITALSKAVPGSTTLRLLRNIPAARFNARDGVVLASSLTDPLIIRSGSGLGTVTLLAISLNTPELVDWESTSQANLLGLMAGVPTPWSTDSIWFGQRRSTIELNSLGLTDLQSQIVMSVNQFQEIGRWTHWVVIGWIALFSLFIGPLDYFVVRKWLGRPVLTWGTLLVWVGLASWLAISVGNAQNARSVPSRQIDVTDIDAENGLIRSRSWHAFYNEDNARLRLSAKAEDSLIPDDVSPIVRVGWVDRPEEGFRGMYRSGGIDETQPAYMALEDLEGFRNYPARIWSTTVLGSEWEAEFPVETLIESDLGGTGINRLVGTFTHHLPGELTDWFLAYKGFAYYPMPGSLGENDALVPGKRWSVSTARSTLLNSLLVGLTYRTTPGEGLQESIDRRRTNYDPLSTDPLQILRTWSFYRSSGGFEYTRLNNSALPEMDLSELVSIDRAVLFGRFKVPTTTLERDDAPLPPWEHDGFVRIVIPVATTGNAFPDAPPSPDILEIPPDMLPGPLRPEIFRGQTD